MIRDMSGYHDVLMEQLHSSHESLAEFNHCLTWEECEADPTFACFAHVYFAAKIVAPDHWTILDLGCYQGIQARFFKQHKAYIGVDASVPLEWRFRQENAKHFLEDGSAWLESHEDARALNVKTTLAICSYVPDDKLNEAVRARFPNVLCYYPSGDRMPVFKTSSR
jgi:hypothetical protein